MIIYIYIYILEATPFRRPLFWGAHDLAFRLFYRQKAHISEGFWFNITSVSDASTGKRSCFRRLAIPWDSVCFHIGVYAYQPLSGGEHNRKMSEWNPVVWRNHPAAHFDHRIFHRMIPKKSRPQGQGDKTDLHLFNKIDCLLEKSRPQGHVDNTDLCLLNEKSRFFRKKRPPAGQHRQNRPSFISKNRVRLTERAMARGDGRQKRVRSS